MGPAPFERGLRAYDGTRMTISHASPRETKGQEPELVSLRRLAEELARGRTERTTTGHLLAAIASAPGPAAELLRERRLDAEVLLKAARVTTDDANDGVTRAVQRARELASRTPSAGGPPAAGAAHLLFALCQERASAAHRALEQCGADVAKLRGAAMQLAMGLAPTRRSFTSRGPLIGQPLAATPVAAPPPTMATSPTRALPPPPKSTLVDVKTLAPPLPMHKRRGRHSVASTARPSVPSGEMAAGEAAPSERFALDPKKYPSLCLIGQNLTLAAGRGELEPVVGRERRSNARSMS